MILLEITLVKYDIFSSRVVRSDYLAIWIYFPGLEAWPEVFVLFSWNLRLTYTSRRGGFPTLSHTETAHEGPKCPSPSQDPPKPLVDELVDSSSGTDT